MDQVIKQYKESTGKDARNVFIVVGKESSKQYKFFTDEFVAWLVDQFKWRPVEDVPEGDGWIFIRCWVNNNKLETWIDSFPFFKSDLPEEWNNLVERFIVKDWMPIPTILENWR